MGIYQHLDNLFQQGAKKESEQEVTLYDHLDYLDFGIYNNS